MVMAELGESISGAQHEVIPIDRRLDLQQKLYHRKFTPRTMYEQFQYMVEMDPVGQFLPKHVGSGGEQGREERLAGFKRFIRMMDWMTNEELDNPDSMNETLIRRIAHLSGHQVYEVAKLMEMYKSQADYYEQLQTRNKRKVSASSRNMSAQHTSLVLSPQVLKRTGGMGDLLNPMHRMASAEDMMGKSCRGLPTERAASKAVKEALCSSELSDDATCIVVDIIPPDNSFQPAESGESISRAIKQISNATVAVDEKVSNECLNKITCALLQSDVQFKLVRDMEYNVKNIVNLEEENKRDILQQAIFSELCKMLDPRKPSFTPQKGKASVIMFVGLQGAGKTTTCAKYAHYHSKKGWKPAIVCADTFSAGGFDQLVQNATKAKIPIYGSCTESDPVKIIVEGVERFKKENFDLIIVDTGVRHKQEVEFFEEMRQASEATKPDLVIFVMDSSIGQAAFDQARAFKQSVSVGAVILTKMDDHAKGCGALSAVAATMSPVIFIGTGENMDDFEVFDAKPFVGRLLGIGNWSGLIAKIHEAVPIDRRHDLQQKLYHRKFTPRTMYEQFQYMVERDPVGQFNPKSLGSGGELVPQGQEERLAGFKRFIHMMDWMTNEELDNPDSMNETLIRRIAHLSGHQVYEVAKLMEMYKSQADYYEQLETRNKRKVSASSRNMSTQVTSLVLAPQVLKQRGGWGDLENPMQQMPSAEDMMGKSCRGLPTERAASKVIKEALRSSELRDDATCLVVDIVPPDHSFLPTTPMKKWDELKSFLSWIKLQDSVDKLSKKLSAIGIAEDLSEESFAMLAESDEEDVHVVAERNCWPGLHWILCLKSFFLLVLLRNCLKKAQQYLMRD